MRNAVNGILTEAKVETSELARDQHTGASLGDALCLIGGE